MRNRQGITIAALIVAIIGLSIGFAAFSNTLTIRSTASVNPSDENFVVKFSQVSNNDYTGSNHPIAAIRNTAATTANITTTNGEIDSSNPLLLTGLSATFTAPGQSVSYKLYVRNTGTYTAYLTNLNFKNIAGTNKAVDCTGNDVTTSLRTAACDDISVTVRIGSSDGQGGDIYTTSNDNIQSDNTKSHKTLTANGGYEEVYVTITYADNSPEANHYVDGNMTVTFGDIMLQYRTVGTPLAIPDPQLPQNPWITPLGLSSSNIVFDQTYSAVSSGSYDVSELDDLDSIILYSTGGLLKGDFSADNETVQTYIDEYHSCIVGEDYFMVNSGDIWEMFVYDGPGTMKYYILDNLEDEDSQPLDFTKSAILAQFSRLNMTPASYEVVLSS